MLSLMVCAFARTLARRLHRQTRAADTKVFIARGPLIDPSSSSCVLRQGALLCAEVLFEPPPATPEATFAQADRLFGSLAAQFGTDAPGKSAVVVALDEESSNLIGMCGLLCRKLPCQRPEGMGDNEEVTRIGYLAVSPAARRQGLATRMVEACEAEAWRWGSRENWLCVEPHNTKAVNLYSKLGYRHVLLDDTVRLAMPDKDGAMRMVSRPVVLMRRVLSCGE
jgi:GNAT superfamily N-acetyltransferase